MGVLSHIWRLNIATLLFFTFVQVVVPLIPRYALVIGATPFLIGLAVSSISITALLFRPVFGILSDKGPRLKFMILGLMLASLAYTILFFSSNIAMIAAARLIEGVAIASFVPSSIASAIDQAPEGKLGKALGWRSLMIGIGFSIGPALGGTMSQFIGYADTFGVTALLLLLILPLIIQKEPARAFHSESSSKGLRERDFLTAFAGLIIYSVGWMGLLTFLSAYLKLLNYGDLEIGLFVSIQAVASLALRVLSGRASDSHPRVLTYSGLLIVSLSFFLVYLTEVPPLVYVAAAVFGIGVGMFIPGSQTLALHRSPPNSRGFLASVYTMGTDIGNFAGPVLFGAIIQVTGSYQDVFALAPAIAFSAAIVVFLPAKLAREGSKS
jgi:MFS family permease